MTADTLKNAVIKNGYQFYDNAPNIIGVRSTSVVPNKFNDTISIVYKQPVLPEDNLSVLQEALNSFQYVGKDNKPLSIDGQKGPNTLFALDQYHKTVGTLRIMTSVSTTLPGVFYLQSPMNASGCAVMVPGQYKSYQLGYHKPGHYALIQTGGKIKVYRDKDLDKYAEEQGVIEEGYFGVDIHHSNIPFSNIIDKWSAGCQVYQYGADHAKMLLICQYYKQSTVNLFTYTLLREREV